MAMCSTQLGARLRVAREDKGLSLREAANVTGMNYTNLCRIELGETSPRFVDVVRLARAFGVSVDALAKAV